jgi:hypothetical protein
MVAQQAEADTPEVLQEEAVDKKLVDDAARWIREKVEATVHKGALEIGEYVLEVFFDGDPDQVRSKSPRKRASFRALVEKCDSVDLPVSRSTLNNAVGVAMMRKSLPSKAAFLQLPSSHQFKLLPLHDPEKVERLANKAVTKEMTLREVREMVVDELAKVEKVPSGLKRPPTPKVLKTLTRSIKLFTVESGRRQFPKAMVEELSQDQKKQALKDAETLQQSLTDLIEKLRG